MLRHFVSSNFLLILISMAACSPPPDPVQCDRSPENRSCRVTNSYGAFPDRSVCRAAAVAYPTTEDELISVVANATMTKTKMKVATRFSHSIPKLVCPDGDDGLLISTKFLNRTLEIDRPAMTMTVESGATLRQVIDAATKAGMALPYTPYWWGLTIGGLIATGAHGSTLWGLGSSVHDYVVQLRIVTPAAADHGYAKVRALAAGDPDLNAARVSLGVLGVVSRVTLKLQPIFKREISYRETNDSDLGDMVGSFGKKHEFADITWYPSQRKAVYRVDDRVSSNVSGDATLDSPGFRSTPSLLLALLRTTEENQERIANADGKCFDGKIATSSLKISGYGLKNNGVVFTGYPVVGYQNHVQASGSCLDSLEDAGLTGCAWDPRLRSLFFHQTTFSIALSKVKSFIEDVQKLVELEPKALCGTDLYNGILMRYVRASSAYLGKQEEAVDFDITYYRSKDPMMPRLYEDVFEEVEQLGLFKYGGLPHWGKNRNLAFIGAVKKYKNIGEFLKVKANYDSVGLFSSDWTDRLLGLKDSNDGAGVTVVKDGCALEGLCVCSQDSHCAPSNGYHCRPGKIYKDARVCTRLTAR